MSRALLITNVIPHYRVPLFRGLQAELGVDIAQYSDGSEWYWQGDAVHGDAEDIIRLGGRKVLGTQVSPAIQRLIASDRYDLVIKGLDGKYALPASYLAARRRGLAFVLWASLWHHPRTPVHRLTQLPTRWLYRHADSVVTYGRHVTEYVVAQGAKREDVFAAPQANDFSLLDPAVKPSVREPTVLFVGRLEPWKGWPVLLEAFAIVARLRPDIRLLVAGAGSGAAQLEDDVDRRGLPGRVQVLGKVERPALAALYRSAMCAVIPSVPMPEFLEPWSFVANEAMHCGCPVIATTAVGAVADGLITDEVTGLVVAPNDPGAMAEAIVRLANEPALRARLAETAADAIAQFTYGAAIDGFRQAIDHALSRSGRC